MLNMIAIFTQKKAVIRFWLDILSVHSWIGAVNVTFDSFQNWMEN